MASKLKIYKPKYPGYAEAPDYEVNCREMMAIWRDMGWVEFSYISEDYIWANKAKTFLIWDRARIDDRPVPPFVQGLFGNTVPNHPQIHHGHFLQDIPENFVRELKRVSILMMIDLFILFLWARLRIKFRLMVD